MSSGSPDFKKLEARAKYAVDVHFEQTETVQSLRAAVRELVELHLPIIQLCGKAAADLLGNIKYLPENQEGGYVDAFMGMHILRSTESALREILEEDAEMRAMVEQYYRDSYNTTSSVDAAVRAEANRFDDEHGGDQNDAYRESAEGFVTDQASTQAIEDSAAGGNAAEQQAKIDAALQAKKTKVEIRQYADGAIRGQHEDTVGDIPENQSVVSDAPQDPSEDDEGPLQDLALKLFHERPERIKIAAPNYAKETPVQAFTKARDWFIDHIIAVAAGSKRTGSYPRIAPLLSKTVSGGFAQTVGSLNETVRAIRHHASKLKAPGEGHSQLDQIRGVFEGLLDDFKNRDKDDPNAGENFGQHMLDMLGGKRKDEPNFADSAREDGGWQEGEGDEWNTKDDSDEEDWQSDDDR